MVLKLVRGACSKSTARSQESDNWLVPNDIVIELWHHGGHWCLEKTGNEYWYKGNAYTEWKAGLPQGMKPRRHETFGSG
jgi:hypothetical protein